MSTTALTPTHHGGFFKAAATIAVAIAIPYAAPAIASSIGLSTVIGNIAASALVGSALGALAAKVTGGNVLFGAAGGAFAGGLGGFAKGGGFSGIGGPAPDPTGFGGVGIDAASGAQYASGVSPTSTVGLTSPTGSVYGGSAGDFAGVFDAPAGTFTDASFVGGQTSRAGVSDVLSGGFEYNPYAATTADSSQIFAQQPSAIPAQVSFVRPDAADVGQFFKSTPQVGVDINPAYAGEGVIPKLSRGSVVTEPLSFGESVSEWGSNLGGQVTKGLEKAFDPANLAQKGVEAAGQFGLSKAAEYFADEVPVSPEEEARLAFLSQQRAEQVRLQGRKEEIATGFLSQARGLSGTGQDASNRAKIAAARAGQTYVRQGSQAPAARLARERQVTLAATRAGGTAQRQQAEIDARRRAALFTSAANVLPTGSELATGAQADLAAADARFIRQQQEQKNFASIFGGLTPTGAKTAAERERELKEELGPPTA
jgi:hypothetical protein